MTESGQDRPAPDDPDVGEDEVPPGEGGPDDSDDGDVDDEDFALPTG